MSQWALPRTLSDHCPIILKEKILNWGPKPFRVFNGWNEIPGYVEFVKEQWGGLQVRGWAAFVVKEKLKLMKQKLKEWSKSNAIDVGHQLKEAREELTRWDVKG